MTPRSSIILILTLLATVPWSNARAENMEEGLCEAFVFASHYTLEPMLTQRPDGTIGFKHPRQDTTITIDHIRKISSKLPRPVLNKLQNASSYDIESMILMGSGTAPVSAERIFATERITDLKRMVVSWYEYCKRKGPKNIIETVRPLMGELAQNGHLQ